MREMRRERLCKAALGPQKGERQQTQQKSISIEERVMPTNNTFRSSKRGTEGKDPQKKRNKRKGDGKKLGGTPDVEKRPATCKVAAM